MKFFRRREGYTLADHKRIKKFWKSWKWNKLTRKNEDTNKIGYDM